MNECVPTLWLCMGISIWTSDSGRTGIQCSVEETWMFLVVTGDNRLVRTSNVFMVLDFPLEVGYTGKMEKETSLNDHPMPHGAPESDQRVCFCLGRAVPGVSAQVLAGGAAGIFVISSQGCPLLASAHSRQIQWPHHSPWLSSWQPRWWCFRNTVFKKRQNTAWQWGVRKNMRETALKALRQEQQEGRRCSRCPSRDSSSVLMENHGDGGSPLQPTGERNPHCSS